MTVLAIIGACVLGLVVWVILAVTISSVHLGGYKSTGVFTHICFGSAILACGLIGVLGAIGIMLVIAWTIKHVVYML